MQAGRAEQRFGAPNQTAREGPKVMARDSASRGPELGNAEQLLDKQQQVLRIIPLEWFYK
jgi:hypothetical protein